METAETAFLAAYDAAVIAANATVRGADHTAIRQQLADEMGISDNRAREIIAESAVMFMRAG